MSNRRVIFAGIGAVFVMIVGVLFFRGDLDDLFGPKEPKMFLATFTLVNECPLADSAFVVKNPSTHRTAPFSNGVAKMMVTEGTRVKLEISASFPDASFAGGTVRAMPETRMVADCGTPDRMRNTMRALSEQFSQ